MSLCSLCKQAISCPFIPTSTFSASPLTSHHCTIRLQCALSPVTWSHTGCWGPTGWQCYNRKGVWLSHRDLSVKRHLSSLPLLLVHFPSPFSIMVQMGARVGKVNDSLSLIWRLSHFLWPETLKHWLVKSIVPTLLSNCKISGNVECMRMCSVLI